MSWGRPRKLFKAKVPELKEYVGKSVVIPGVPEPVKIEHICGNVGLTLGRPASEIRPQFYEINGKHLIGMLRFHAQMTGATDITEQQMMDFEQTEFYAEKQDDKKIVDIEPIMKKMKESE